MFLFINKLNFIPEQKAVVLLLHGYSYLKLTVGKLGIKWAKNEKTSEKERRRLLHSKPESRSINLLIIKTTRKARDEGFTCKVSRRSGEKGAFKFGVFGRKLEIDSKTWREIASTSEI